MLLLKFGRGTNFDYYDQKLKTKCDQTWLNGRQQCEFLSLRGNQCIKPIHNAVDVSEHSSGAEIISTCNCGRTQGRRPDPYTVRQANYEFYNILGGSCTTCADNDRINFPVFRPSTNDVKYVE